MYVVNTMHMKLMVAGANGVAAGFVPARARLLAETNWVLGLREFFQNILVLVPAEVLMQQQNLFRIFVNNFYRYITNKPFTSHSVSI